MHDFAAAIFDLDGTLLDSMHVWEKIDFYFLSKRGIPVPEDYARTIAPLSFQQVARYTIDRFSLKTTEEEIMREWQDMARHEYANEIRLKNHAFEYLTALKQRGVKLATATSLHPELSEPVLRNNGIYDFFDVQCSTDEVGRGKEFPDIFLLAAERLNTQASSCVVFEDILPAVRSAKRARMRVYCIQDDASSHDEAELRKIADGYFRDFREAPLPSFKPIERE
ncbi:HAD family phosphatase [Synergistaceae bacterium OttesenSCG-928-I11]|nr:HAD family phosphatase [Synergistaceae bacterium OttesenSCG-928-I11]